MGWTLAGIILVTTALVVAHNLRSKDMADAFQRVSGFVAAALLVYLVALIIVPNLLKRAPGDVKRWWKPVVGDTLSGLNLSGYDTAGVWVPADDGQWRKPYQESWAPPPEPTATRAYAAPPPPRPTAVMLQPDPEPGQTYRVQRGDFLARIAARFGVTVDSLLALNNLADANRIYPGQTLVITAAPPPTATAVPEPPTDETAAAPPPEPTATPRLDPALYLRLDQLRNNRDMDPLQRLQSAAATAGRILEAQPGDETATAVLAAVSEANARIDFWNQTHADHEALQDSMRGISFLIVDDGGRFFSSTASEIATVRVVSPGWLFGYEFQAQRLHLIRICCGDSGDSFTVE